MTRINLFPWREQLEEQKKRQFILFFMFSNIIIVFIMLITTWSYSSAINSQKENNEYLNSELVVINKVLRQIDELKAQKQALISRLSVIQRIDSDRYYTLDLFNEIVNLINPMIILTNIKRTDNLVKLTGVAESNTEVAKFLRALEVSPYFKRAELNQIKVNDPVTQDVPVGAVPIKKEQNELTHNFELQFYQSHIVNSGNDTDNQVNLIPNTTDIQMKDAGQSVIKDMSTDMSTDMSVDKVEQT